MSELLSVGQIIHGFAEGAFGRDSYDCRRIEAVGPDWIVTRDESGFTDFVSGRGSLERCQRARKPHGHTGERCCDFVAEKPLTDWKP